MEESGRSNRLDRDTRDLGTKIFLRIHDYIEAEENRGFAWQSFGGRQRSRDMKSCLHRLASTTTVTEDHPSGSDHVLQAPRENVEQHMISGVVLRCIRERNRDTWNLEKIWDNVDMNGVGVDQDHELHSVNYNVHSDVRLGMAANINVIWYRVIKDWGRLDGNALSSHIFWSGNFAESRRVLQQLEDMNTPNSMEIIRECIDLHCNLRAEYIARHQTHPLAAAVSAVDCLPTVIANEELVAQGMLLCAVCQNEISIGMRVKQLRCNHLFHRNCIRKWYYRRLSCPLCRNEFQ